MSVRDYKELENHIIDICDNKENIVLNGVKYELSKAGRPIVKGNGECKTDVLIRLYKHVDNLDDFLDIKISIKQSNAEFLANKLKPIDAENLFGENWKDIVIQSVETIKDKFECKKLSATSKKNGMRYTLGWRLEVANKSRVLASKLQIPKQEIIDVIYKGKSLSDDKKNAYVFGNEVKNSGIADFLLEGNKKDFKSIEDILNKIQEMDSLNVNNVHLIFTASNYFPDKESKIEGNRYLAVYVDWDVIDNELKSSIVFDQPLKYKGVDDILPSLLKAIDQPVQSLN